MKTALIVIGIVLFAGILIFFSLPTIGQACYRIKNIKRRKAFQKNHPQYVEAKILYFSRDMVFNIHVHSVNGEKAVLAKEGRRMYYLARLFLPVGETTIVADYEPELPLYVLFPPTNVATGGQRCSNLNLFETFQFYREWKETFQKDLADPKQVYQGGFTFTHKIVSGGVYELKVDTAKDVLEFVYEEGDRHGIRRFTRYEGELKEK